MNTMASPSQLVRRYWWIAVVQGIISLVIGMVALAWPIKTTEVIIYLFSAYALLSGAGAIIVAFLQRHTSPRWWLGIIVGILGVLLGFAMLSRPGIAALIFLDLIAIWAVFTGMVQVLLILLERDPTSSRWLSFVVAVLTIILGLALVARPYIGLLTLVYTLGIVQLINGIFHLLRAYRLHNVDTI